MQNISQTYLTQAPQPHHNPNSLRSYVSHLDEKLDYARWKQDLILSYNYLPLTNIKQKLQNDRATYLKKMEAQEKKLRALVDNEEIITLLGQLGGFRGKLKDDVERTEGKIGRQRAEVSRLEGIVREKREELKRLKRISRYSIVSELQEQGIKSARDLKTLIRSRSTLTNTNANTHAEGSQTRRSVMKYQPNKHNVNELFANCCRVLFKTDKNKNSQGKMSDRYGKNSKIKGETMEQGQANYNSVPINIHANNGMAVVRPSWEEFIKLDFNQMMDLIAVKDPTGAILKQLL